MAAAPSELRTFHQALADLEAWLTDAKIPGVVIGGVAVALLARPRMTQDLDVVVLVDENRLDEFATNGAKHGFVARVSDAVVFAAQSRILLMRHDPSALNVDVSLGALPFEYDMIANAQRLHFSGITVRLPRPEDLFLLKLIAQRDRDIVDLQSLVQRTKKLDRTYIRRLAKELASILDQPDLPEVADRFLTKPRRK